MTDEEMIKIYSKFNHEADGNFWLVKNNEQQKERCGCITLISFSLV